MGVYWLAANHTKQEYIEPKGSLKLSHQLREDGLGGMLLAMLNHGKWNGDQISLYADESGGDGFGNYYTTEDDYTDVSDTAVELARGMFW